MRTTISLAGLAMLLAGCESFVAQGYVSPRVTGRVLDAATRAPLAQVSVRRLTSSDGRGTYSNLPQRGGEMLMNQDTVRTGRDGRFTLAPESVALSVASTLAVQLELQRAHYQTLATNLPASLVRFPTNRGAPVLNAGDLLMLRTAP